MANCRLYLAPASAGKTAFAVELAAGAARRLEGSPRVLVPNHLQVQAFRRRIAQAGGAVGVRVGTFDQLCGECLAAARRPYVLLSEPVQYRLLRTVVETTPLAFYASLRDSPGFIQLIERLIHELKAANVAPAGFASAVMRIGGEARLAEIAGIYAAYQARLDALDLSDRPGVAALALAALDADAALAADWDLLVVDGFAGFTAAELEFLRRAARRVKRLVITLTGDPAGRLAGTQAGRGLGETLRTLETVLGARAEALPPHDGRAVPQLAYLATGLFQPAAPTGDLAAAAETEPGPAVCLQEAPDRAGETRAALRWLRERMVADGMAPGDLALLARAITPYRPLIVETAAEFGLPIRLEDGVPLRSNPAVAGLLDLLRLLLPAADAEDSEPQLSPRLLCEAWRSPYFDWSAEVTRDAPIAISIAEGDAIRLAAAARWGRVLGGLAQWLEVLDDLAARTDKGDGSSSDDERGVDPGVPIGAAAAALRERMLRFTQRLTPPAGQQPYRAFVGWLETLIGADPTPSARYPVEEDPTSLRVVARAREGDPAVAARDIAALVELKDALRSLVWAEDALGVRPVDYVTFVQELAGTIDAATYLLPPRSGEGRILVADVASAAGLPFRAVAVLGLAEGEFPATVQEDPFLPDADRARLRGEGLSLEPSTASIEAQLFYETVARPRERLLLTRPRLADNGAPWQASPYWDEVCRLLGLTGYKVEGGEDLAGAASWPELMERAAARCGDAALAEEAVRRAPERWPRLSAAKAVIEARGQRRACPHDGDLSAIAADLARDFGPEHLWSVTRLEKHAACPFYAFAANALNLEARDTPAEGLDVRQLGNLHHRILAQLYNSTPDTSATADLLERLPRIAADVLGDAPRREGFRPNAWWEQTKAEVVRNLQRTVAQIEGLDVAGGWRAIAQELPFFGDRVLVVRDGDDSFLVHGVIDRVDRAADGRLRVIDYKTAGPDDFTAEALAEGKKLQLAVYALALRDALGFDLPADGFYWHLQKAVASPLALGSYEGGIQAAVADGTAAMRRAVRAARAGDYAPRPPKGGCPDYCPAGAFCWHYRPRYGG